MTSERVSIEEKNLPTGWQRLSMNAEALLIAGERQRALKLLNSISHLVPENPLPQTTLFYGAFVSELLFVMGEKKQAHNLIDTAVSEIDNIERGRDKAKLALISALSLLGKTSEAIELSDELDGDLLPLAISVISANTERCVNLYCDDLP